MPTVQLFNSNTIQQSAYALKFPHKSLLQWIGSWTIQEEGREHGARVVRDDRTRLISLTGAR